MPPPIVPAPMIPTRLDRQGRGVIGHVGDLPHLTFGEEHMALRLRLRRAEQFHEGGALALGALVERQLDGVLHRLERPRPRLEAAEFAGVRLADRLEDFRLAARRRHFVVAVAHLHQRQLLVDHPAGEGERALAQMALGNDLVDDAPCLRLPGGERRPRQDHLGRRLGPDQPRQPLRAAGAGDQAELDLRQAELRRRHGDAVMADQRDLEAAAERRAVDGGDDRLRRVLDRALRLRQADAAERLAEFGDVGAGDEGAAAADQHDRLDRGIDLGLLDAVADALPHVGRERVDRWRVDRQHADVALVRELGDSIDRWHGASPGRMLAAR